MSGIAASSAAGVMQIGAAGGRVGERVSERERGIHLQQLRGTLAVHHVGAVEIGADRHHVVALARGERPPATRASASMSPPVTSTPPDGHEAEQVLSPVPRRSAGSCVCGMRCHCVRAADQPSVSNVTSARGRPRPPCGAPSWSRHQALRLVERGLGKSSSQRAIRFALVPRVPFPGFR
jgi:hypothetical protein